VQRNDDGSVTVSREEAHVIRGALFVAAYHFGADDLHIFTGKEQPEVAAVLQELDSVSQPDAPYWRARAIESHLDALAAMSDQTLRLPQNIRQLQAVAEEARALGMQIPARLSDIEGA
jgi:hypothetical protein